MDHSKEKCYEKLEQSLTKINNILIAEEAIIKEILEILRNEPSSIHILIKLVVKFNQIGLLAHLLERRNDSGIDLDVLDHNQLTPLMKTIWIGNFEIAKLLINANCNLNIRNLKEETALFFAVAVNSKELVEELIKHGADVNAQNVDGDTPLQKVFYTFRYSHVYPADTADDMALLLLKNGADVNIPNKRKFTIVHNAILTRRETIMEAVLNAGANLDLITRDNHTSALILLFLCFRHEEDLLVHALQFNCDVNLADYNSRTALHYAVESHLERAAYELIRKGANIDKRDYNGNTSLHIAITNRDEEIACMLLYYGANANILNYSRYSPVVKAMYYSPQEDLPHIMLDCYDLNGEDRYYILDAVAKNLEMYDGNEEYFKKALVRFEEGLNENVECFQRQYHRLTRIKRKMGDPGMYLRGLEKLLTIISSIRLKKFDVREYFPFYRYYSDILRQGDAIDRNGLVKLLWLSLSLGISVDAVEINSLIQQFSFCGELEALIFGGFTKQLLKQIFEEGTYCSRYFRLLNSDVESKEGKGLVVEILCDPEMDDPNHCSKLLRFFSLHASELGLISTEEFDDNVLSELRQIPRVKKLKELSRNQVRASLIEGCKGESFDETHYAINDLSVDVVTKKYLQLRYPNDCSKCNFRFCECYLELLR